MDVGSIIFLVFLALVAIAYQLLRGPSLRQTLLIAANLAFLFTFVKSPQSWAALAVFIFLGFVMVKVSQTRLRGAGLALFIAGLLAAFLYVKNYAFLGLVLPDNALNQTLVLIGISYMLFKLIHMLVDGWQQELPKVNFLTYVNYQLSFFTLLAGPIQRYNDFAQFWENMDGPAPGNREVILAWSRILTGAIKMALLGWIALNIYERASSLALTTDSRFMAAASFGALFYAYPAFVYFNFSGYTDIVIGAGRLFGLDLPENFNRPYLARNMVDFWNRWHITLSTWIRDYVFMTSYKWVAAKWSVHARRLGYLLAFGSLFLAGLWHGSTWNFVLFGLVHGIGVASTQIYGQSLRSAIGAVGVRRYMDNRWITLGAMLVTFHYVCVGFLFFPSDLSRTLEIIRHVFLTLV